MSRLNEIYQQIITATEAESEISGLNAQAGENMNDFVSEISTSKVSIWRLWSFIVAFYIWLHEKTDITFRAEYEQRARLKQVTTLRWYQQKVLNYLFGKPLVWNEELEVFEQVLADGEDIEDFQVIKYCAVTPAPNQIRVKVAGDNGGVPGQITAPQETALTAFLNQIKTAGDNIEVVNNTADLLNIELDVYVDPLVIDISTGELLAESGLKPIEDAIDAYLLNLEFNGRFVTTKFIDTIQEALGFADVNIVTLEHKFGAFPYQPINVSIVPDAGYFAIDSLTINYLPAQ